MPRRCGAAGAAQKSWLEPVRTATAAKAAAAATTAKAAAAAAKITVNEMALRVTSEAIQVHGGYGFTDEFPVSRFYRGARYGRDLNARLPLAL